MEVDLDIDEELLKQALQEAARRGRTPSALVEEALTALFEGRPAGGELPPLPTFGSGGHLVDIDDRDALYDAVEGHREGPSED